MPLFKVWSEDKLNKKYIVAENFAELCPKVSDSVLNMPGGWGIWPSLKLQWVGHLTV